MCHDNYDQKVENCMVNFYTITTTGIFIQTGDSSPEAKQMHHVVLCLDPLHLHLPWKNYSNFKPLSEAF